MALVERAAQLEVLSSALDGAVRGEGGVVVVGGEAGAGKSALVGCFCDSSAAVAPASWGACEPLSAPRPLGPLVDIAPRLGGDVADRIRAGDREGAFDAALAALVDSTTPRIVVFEDVHWADASTLDLIQVVSRRIASMRVLLVVTYRDDDLPLTHPLRFALGDLVSVPAVRRLTVPPLSLEAVTTLATGSGIDPDVLHHDTAGNAFFVTQILANGSQQMPSTVADAVLTRVGRLRPGTRAALEAAAVAGPRIEPSLVLRMRDVDATRLDECVTLGMLRFDPPYYAFRHELARQAVLAVIPAQRLAGLHAEVLELLRSGPTADGQLARLADHADKAGDATSTVELAMAAAVAAAGLDAHREAAFQYGRALRYSAGMTKAEHAELLEQRAYECYLVDLLSDAIEAGAEAVELRRELGQPLRVADDLLRLSRVWWIAGSRQDAERLAQEAFDVLAPLPPGPELAKAFAAQSRLRMVAHDLDSAITWGEKAIELAERLDDKETLAHALNTVGTSRLQRGEPAGETMVMTSLRLSLDAGLEDDAARAWTNLETGCLSNLDFRKSRDYLAAGLAYCVEHDLYSAAMCLRADQTLHLLIEGRWDEASESAVTLLESRVVARISRISALVVLARIRARRGQSEVWPILDEARSIATPTHELQWLAPVAAARAEAHWLAGQADRIEGEVGDLYERALSVGDGLVAGELAMWLRRGGCQPATPGRVPTPYALQLAGDCAAAAASWTELGFPYEAALALADSPGESDLRSALARFEALGAIAAARVVARQLRAAGVRSVPRGPQPTTRSNPAGLTAREIDVLRLLERGMRDADIAAALFVSVRTVGHHVSSILTKLDVESRHQAAELAPELLAPVAQS